MPPESKLLSPTVTSPPASMRTLDEGIEQNLKPQSVPDEEREQELKRQRIADEDRQQELKRQRIADEERERERDGAFRLQQEERQRVLYLQHIADAERARTQELKRRFFQAIGVVVATGVIGAGGILYESMINQKYKNSFLISVGLSLIGLVIIASLQFLTKERPKTSDALSAVEQRFSNAIDGLRNEHSNLVATRNFYLTDKQTLTPEEHNDLVKNIQKQLVEDSIRDLIEQSAKEKINQSGKHLIFLRQKHDQAMDRLIKEISDLNNKSVYNLIIGVITTLGALGLLAYVALTAKDVGPDIKSVLFHYLPRLSIVVFAEVFAFFFLKNYRNNLDGIRYFHNEITNIEARCLAVEAACYTGDKAMLNGVIDSLAKTERNFRLQKDETTPDIEQSKIEANGIKEILGSLATILQKGKGG